MPPKAVYPTTSRKDQAIAEQRRKLEQLRLQTESQNTKLLKIQQKEREIEAQYQNERRNMEDTLAKLSLEQEKFEAKQIKTTEQFNTQKEQIFANDRKKESYLKQKEELKQRNHSRSQEIMAIEDNLKAKKEQLEHIRKSIKVYQIYQEFLREVRNLSDDFGPADMDQFSVMSILDRYNTMERKKQELAEVHRRISSEKQDRIKSIQQMRKLAEERSLQYSKKIKDLKEKIDSLNEENLQLESELEGHLNENCERQREVGQVIFSIRGLYLSIVGEDKQAKGIIEMLGVIKEERKKLKEYLELYNKKIEEAKRSADKKE